MVVCFLGCFLVVDGMCGTLSRIFGCAVDDGVSAPISIITWSFVML